MPNISPTSKPLLFNFLLVNVLPIKFVITIITNTNIFIKLSFMLVYAKITELTPRSTIAIIYDKIRNFVYCFIFSIKPHSDLIIWGDKNIITVSFS